MSLFRSTAVDAAARRQVGELLLLPRISHVLIAGILLLWIGLLIAWSAISDYAVKESVSGWIATDSTATRVFAARPGQVKEIYVTDGQRVEQGDPLVLLNGDQFLASGHSLQSTLLAEAHAQSALLAQRISATTALSALEGEALKARLAGAERERELLLAQVRSLAEAVALANEQRARSIRLSNAGHLSRDEADSVAARSLQVRIEHKQLERELEQASIRVHNLRSSLQEHPQRSALNERSLRQSASELAADIARMEGQRSQLIRAPVAGSVQHLQVARGHRVTQSAAPLMVLLPDTQALKAELMVPVRAAGFITPGQTVRLRLNAFPYQKHGFWEADIVSVAQTVTLPHEFAHLPVPVAEPVYRVVAAILPRSAGGSSPEPPRLKSGMTLVGDVHLGKRSLLAWVVEPLLTLRGALNS